MTDQPASPQETLGRILEELRKGDQAGRLAAIRELHQLNYSSEAVLAELEHLAVKDDHPEIRTAALSALDLPVNHHIRTLASKLGRGERYTLIKEIEEWEKNGTIERYTKKEKADIMREKRRLLRNLGGIRAMDHHPSVLVIIDPSHEKNAVAEASKIGAATVGLIDTDSDPDKIDVLIPCNDDSMKVIQIIISKLSDAVIEGRAKTLGAVIKEENKAADTTTKEKLTVNS